jgi:hypothetical protein
VKRKRNSEMKKKRKEKKNSEMKKKNSEMKRRITLIRIQSLFIFDTETGSHSCSSVFLTVAGGQAAEPDANNLLFPNTYFKTENSLSMWASLVGRIEFQSKKRQIKGAHNTHIFVVIFLPILRWIHINILLNCLEFLIK